MIIKIEKPKPPVVEAKWIEFIPYGTTFFGSVSLSGEIRLWLRFINGAVELRACDNEPQGEWVHQDQRMYNYQPVNLEIKVQ